ncbi:glyceraldehyde-3-phosphate dehydrogenase (NAD+) [Desulfonatronum thiosulfatophilum]|uniref:Glyceraldehyde-3-phosphate dehydrogenase n=1 Tax=Desulfonatronum thiosulfatophilum TaxID=617002 RepID=A0A1G6B1Z3_9BACT|nr:type I glyceraldehyde-3-phosphate dehydrogenase [Desulfonatronum thiosulfatophilum]SDB14691.1 glyceraldehyde-3-phosphate dehydrogenase (NAD+) [Desulfonatronum thiosulfatophilum]
MQKINIGINGFGRIGRQVLKAIHEKHADRLQVVAVNDLFDVATNVHLFKFDTSYGRFRFEAGASENQMTIGDWTVSSFAQRDPSQIPWQDVGVDIVLECTGIFRSRATAGQHLQAGAKKVIISAPAKEEDVTLVLGVNQDRYDPQKHHILSNASCTTNCLAPPVKVLHDAFGIVKGTMTTVHSYTNDQRILDLPHKDLRRARAAACNIIPTSTGAARALALVMPEMKGRFDGYSLRVPTPTVSVVDCSILLERETTTEELRATLKSAADGPLHGILGYADLPLVSSDFIGDDRSSIVDEEFTLVMGGQGNLIKLVAWYDNEWGYSCRLADLAAFLAEKGL